MPFSSSSESTASSTAELADPRRVEMDVGEGCERGRATLLVMSGTTMFGFAATSDFSTFTGGSEVTQGGKVGSCCVSEGALARGTDVSSLVTVSGPLLEFAKHWFQ